MQISKPEITQYIIVDTYTGNVRKTTSLKAAESFIDDEDYFVIDSTNMTWMIDGDSWPIKEIKFADVV